MNPPLDGLMVAAIRAEPPLHRKSCSYRMRALHAGAEQHSAHGGLNAGHGLKADACGEVRTRGRIWVWVHCRRSAKPNGGSLLCGRLIARSACSDCSRRRLQAIAAHVMQSREHAPSAVASLTSQKRSGAGSPAAPPHVRSAAPQRPLPRDRRGRPQQSLTWVRMPWAPRRTPPRPWDWPRWIVQRLVTRRSTGSSAACPWRPGLLYGGFRRSVRIAPVRLAQAFSHQVSSARSSATSRLTWRAPKTDPLSGAAHRAPQMMRPPTNSHVSAAAQSDVVLSGEGSQLTPRWRCRLAGKSHPADRAKGGAGPAGEKYRAASEAELSALPAGYARWKS